VSLNWTILAGNRHIHELILMEQICSNCFQRWFIVGEFNFELELFGHGHTAELVPQGLRLSETSKSVYLNTFNVWEASIYLHFLHAYSKLSKLFFKVLGSLMRKFRSEMHYDDSYMYLHFWNKMVLLQQIAKMEWLSVSKKCM